MPSWVPFALQVLVLVAGAASVYGVIKTSVNHLEVGQVKIQESVSEELKRFSDSITKLSDLVSSIRTDTQVREMRLDTLREADQRIQAEVTRRLEYLERWVRDASTPLHYVRNIMMMADPNWKVYASRKQQQEDAATGGD